MKRKLGSKLGFLMVAVVMAYSTTACVVVDDDYQCDDGEWLLEAGDVSCDGYIDCYDGSDEWYCSGCDPAYDYECADGECLVNMAGMGIDCDSVADCDDYSDELACDGCYADEVLCEVMGAFECAVMCDGADECDDYMDEDAYYCGY